MVADAGGILVGFVIVGIRQAEKTVSNMSLEYVHFY